MPGNEPGEFAASRFPVISEALCLGIFPGLWILSVVLLCVQDWTALIFSCVGAAAWFITVSAAGIFYAVRLRESLNKVVFGITCGIIALCAFPGTLVAEWLCSWSDDPIGLTTDNGRGGDPCSVSDDSAVSNGADYLASVRESTCPVGWGADVRWFVFVRKAVAENAHSNLVLRFVQGDENPTTVTSPEPRISWRDDKTLTITVSDSGYEVTKQLKEIDGIRILYEFDPQRERGEQP
jgi:hypothetical protein